MAEKQEIESLLRLIKDAGLEDDSRVQCLVKAAAVTGSSVLVRDLKRVLTVKTSQRQAYPFDETGSTVSGSVGLGISFSGSHIRVSSSDLNRHLLAVGQSGSGKTTFFYNLIGELDLPVWCLDLKQDYRHLAEEDEDLLVLPWSQLRFNPLRPPQGVSPRRWAQVFVEMFGHATSLLSGSKNYLLKQVITLYRLYGLFEEVNEPYPSLHELQQLIEQNTMSYTRKQSNYRDTVLNRLEAMNLTAGTIFDCSSGFGVEDLLGRSVVFEFDGLGRDVQNLLMETLFAYVYEYRVAQNHRNKGLEHIFLLDEGKSVFSVYKERSDAAGLPAIDELTARMREFGEGLIVGDQEASKLTQSLKANTFTKVLLPTGDHRQFSEVANSLNLSQRQRSYAYKLGVGEAIVQVGNQDPVPVKLDNYALDKEVDNDRLRQLQQETWESLDHTPRDTTIEFENRVAPNRSDTIDEPDIVEDPSSGEVSVSSEADRLLKNVVESPFKALTDRYNGFSSSYKGNKAKNELVENGVVIERHVHTRSGRRKLLQLTEKGRNYVNNVLDLETNHGGRGGIVHQYWQHRIKGLFESAGWRASLETHYSDVYVNTGWMELVIEIAMGDNPREIQHLEDHLETGFDAVWIVARNQEILDGLRQRIQEKEVETDRVTFRLLRDFNNDELPQV